MNRRAFFGAFAALLALPAAAITNQSVQKFAGCSARGERLRFDPFGHCDWIDFPSEIVDLIPHTQDTLLVRCVGGDYTLSHAGTPERDWYVRQVA